MMAHAVTYEHDGVLYEVQDIRYDGIREKRVRLNSRHADARKFIPRDSAVPTRIFAFRGGINYGTSDQAMLAQQFKFSVPVARR